MDMGITNCDTFKRLTFLTAGKVSGAYIQYQERLNDPAQVMRALGEMLIPPLAKYEEYKAKVESKT